MCIVTTSQAQEWSIGGELGATLLSFFQYTPVYQGAAYFDRGYTIPHNEGWIFHYYSKKKRFFSVAYTRFHPRSTDILIRTGTGGGQGDASAFFNHIVSLNVGQRIKVGHRKTFFEPLCGIGIEVLQGGRPYPTTGLLNLETWEYKQGINPSLQTGFRIASQHPRSKFAIKILGNLGLRYHATKEYSVLLPEVIYATTRSKSDFIAVQASYECRFALKKNKKKKKK